MSDCLFCKIADGTVPSKKIYEDGDFMAFNDIAPMSPVHFLVIPKKHIENVMETGEADVALLGRLLVLGQKLAKEQGLKDGGARFVINCKKDGGQTVPHLHLHILGGRPMNWPPG